jgi:hypothetical protein
MKKIDFNTNEEIITFIENSINFRDDKYYVYVNPSIIYSLKMLFIDAIEKATISNKYEELTLLMQTNDYDKKIISFIKFAKEFELDLGNTRIRGPTALSYDYYLKHDGYFKNSYFLFGTPSQFNKV